MRKNPYEDMLYMSHPTSKTHPRMSMEKRAAQFAPFAALTGHGRLREAELMGRTKKIPLKYFTVTFFKKGTCHIEFTNLELLKKLNIFGAQNKHWLPPSYGKKTYQEMNPEEQQVIDDFEGKESNKWTAPLEQSSTGVVGLLR